MSEKRAIIINYVIEIQQSFQKGENSRSPLLSKEKKNSKILFDFLFYNELAVLLSIELRSLLLSMSQFTVSKVEYEIEWKFRES